MVNHKQSLELKTTHETVRIGTSIVGSLVHNRASHGDD